jgi:dTDP-4-amino-4,6-dideoxygalactose transaminase
MEFIPFALPDLGDDEINEVVDSMKSGWVTTGPKVQRFEKEFSEYTGAKFSLSVNSATSGLHLALDAIGITQGDKVIVPTYTFTSTAEVVRYFDAHPVFCDVDPKTYNIDLSALKKVIAQNPDAKAIMPVHFAGQSCEMDEIIALAKKHGMKVIEDAAHALPTTHKKKLIGNLDSDMTVFSFYATKTLCTAEGGMITTNNEDYAKRMKIMRLHGFDRDAWNRYNSKQSSWFYSIVAPGYKYNMPDIAAAMGIHQLKKANKFFERRMEIANKYQTALAKIPSIELPFIAHPEDKHAFHLYVIKVPAEIRGIFIDKMRENQVGCSVHFIPLHLQPYWKEKYNLKENDFPNALAAFNQVVSLPLYTKMTNDQVDHVILSVKKVMSELL